MVVTLYQPDLGAWACKQVAPHLRGRALLVQRGGRVVARSHDLHGIVGLGWPVERALAQVPEAQVERYDEGTCLVAWEAVLGRLQSYTPWIEIIHDGTPAAAGLLGETGMPPSLWDAAARAYRAGAGFGAVIAPVLACRAAQRAALVVQADLDPGQAAEVVRWTGFQAGLARDRVTAFLAALQAVPGRLLQLSAAEEVRFREGVSLSLLLEAGAAPASLQRLHWLGYSSLAQLAALSRSQLEAQLVDGGLLHALAAARFCEPVASFVPSPRVVARADADEPWCEPAEYEPVLQHLLQQAVDRLQGHQARLLGVTLCFEDGAACTARRSAHEPTSQLRVLRPLLVQATRSARATRARQVGSPSAGREPGRPLGICTCEVVLAGLTADQGVQSLLFTTRPALQEAVDRVEMRRPGTSLRFVAHDPAGYLPERAYHLVPRLPRAAARREHP